MAISKITADELRLARKGGFGRKKPKKPKQSSTLNTLENWVVRYNAWVKDAKAKAAEYKKAKTLKDAIRNART